MKNLNWKDVFARKFYFVVALLMVVTILACGSGSDDMDDFTPPIVNENPAGDMVDMDDKGDSGDSGDTGNEPTETLENAPDFSLTTLSGSTVKLSDFSNKVVVLFFFGNSCPSCKAVAPSVESELVSPFSSRTDYQVLGLDNWNGSTNSVQAFKTSTNVSFPLLLNASSVASSYNTTYDRLIVINKTGKIVFSGKQLVTSDLAAVKSKVTELLNN